VADYPNPQVTQRKHSSPILRSRPEEDVMTQNEVDEGSVVDLLARITQERSQTESGAEPEADVVEAPPKSEGHSAPPTRLFPGAPRRRRT
jgi:hypothetical protein